MDRKVVIAGGSGFIGQHLVRDMLDHGWAVTVTSRTGATIPNTQHYSAEQLQVVAADLAETDRMAELLRGATTFIHLVHATVPAESMADLTCDLTATLLPTVRLMGQLPPECRRVVYVSSGGTVYGETGCEPTSEDHTTEPRSAYGAAKLAIEKYVKLCSETTGVSAAIVRPANVYGPGQRTDRPQGAVAVFMDRLLRRVPVRVWGTGETVRDYVHVYDVARALRQVAEDNHSGTWNVGCGRGHSLKELIDLLQRVTGVTAQVTFESPHKYDVPFNVLDSSRLRETLGWQPGISLEEGVRMLFDDVMSTSPATN